MATVVTGATGFIGSHITRKLVERGDRVKVLVRKTSNTRNIDSLDVEKVYGDVGDPASLKAAFSGCDKLFHTAGFVSFKKSDRQKMLDINVRGAANVLSAAMDVGVSKVVFTSSVAAIGVERDGSSYDRIHAVRSLLRGDRLYELQVSGGKRSCNLQRKGASRRYNKSFGCSGHWRHISLKFWIGYVVLQEKVSGLHGWHL